MAKFRFNLQNVLDIKDKMESQAKQEFAMAAGELQQQKEVLILLENRKEMLLIEGQELLTGKLDFRDIDDNKLSYELNNQKIEEQKRVIRQAEIKLENARKKMSEAMAEKKTYDKLREKAFEEYVASENKAEEKQVDELVSYTYGQKL